MKEQPITIFPQCPKKFEKVCLVQCTGDWEITTNNLIKTEGIPENIEQDEDIFGNRMFPYIALPKNS